MVNYPTQRVWRQWAQREIMVPASGRLQISENASGILWDLGKMACVWGLL